MSEQYGVPTALLAPGLIIKATVSLGEPNSALQFEGYLDRDCEQAEIDALCAKMVNAGNRERAKAELPGLRHKLKYQEGLLRENRARKAGVDAKLEELAKLRSNKALELQVERDAAMREDQDRWNESGRRAEYKPQGGVAARLARFDSEIAALTTDQHKDDSAAMVQLSEIDGQINGSLQAIAQLKELIDDFERLARHEDISGTE